MAIELSRRARNARAFRVRLGFFALVTAAALAANPAQALFTQQGGKLVGSGAVGNPVFQGTSVALSTDGNTAIVGGPEDNTGQGAAWIFTRSSGAWTQQGDKLVGTGAVGNASQGTSVALSADGNTAIVGGFGDNGDAGAAWVYTRNSNGIWTQEGGKLVGTGAAGAARQGGSVALSADGNTALVGGINDNGIAGAVWVFTRDSNGVWTQQGNKLVGAGAGGNARQGTSVALSADGNTAVVGGPQDMDGLLPQGAAWIFTRSAGVWTQQGGKLVGTGAVDDGNGAAQGSSVALSADGNTALVGGNSDGGGSGSPIGATWVFTRNSNGVWTQQGNKLVGSGRIPSQGNGQGSSVALSANGSLAIVGAPNDNGFIGAVWVFRRSRTGLWAQFGQKLVGTGASGNAAQGASVALSGDGSTALVGGSDDNGDAGAAWVFRQPAVTEVIPNAGTASGGTNVLIIGSNLTGVTGVTFSGVPATNVLAVDSEAVFATTPAHAIGKVDVTVTTSAGYATAKGAYTYQALSTATFLVSSANPSKVRQPVTFKAVVVANGAPATGNVTFRDGTRGLATRTLQNGVATFATRALAAGTHVIRAVYRRNGKFAGSAATLNQTVK